jgi:hypothetical protein
VRLPWSAPPPPRAELEDGAPLPAEETGDEVTPAPLRSGDLRQAAGHLARGAVGLALGVWDGVTGRQAPDTPPTPRRTPGDDVVSLQTLEEPDPDHRAGLPAPLAYAGARPAAVALGPVQALKLPVPVPPRGEGGLVGTVSSAFVLGAEILGALLTGPVLALLRGSRALIDRLVHGLPGVLGGAVRLALFLLLCMGIGAVAALVFMGAVMGGNLYIR